MLEPGRQSLSRARENGPGRLDDEGVTVLLRERLDARIGDQRIDGRKFAKSISAAHERKMIRSRSEGYVPTSMTEIAALLSRPIRRLRPLTLAAICTAIVLVAVAAALLVRAYTLRDAVLPGVHVSGVDIGGLSRADARARITSSIGERLRGPVKVSVNGESITVHPGTLFTVDAVATEQIAYDSPRRSWTDRVGALAAPFAFEHEVAPVLRVNPTVRAALAQEIEERTGQSVSARISLEGLEPVVVPGRTGTQVDPNELLRQIRDAVLGSEAGVEAHVTTLQPKITTAAAQDAAREARALLSAPVALRYRHKQLDDVEPARIAELLQFEPVAGGFELGLSRAGIKAELGPLMRPFTRAPVDARFRIDGKRVHIVKGHRGTTLDARDAEQAILAEGGEEGSRSAVLGLTALEPKFTKEDARALGIKRQISTYTTDMGVSSSNRIWNVHLMADYIDGTIIKPGQVFSFNKAVGPRTVERGFREGQMILGSLLLPAIGGGVCQTATTLFNNAFELGLPVVERHNHSWYISHYPIGRDATVSWGGPDLKFRNDLDNAILIKTSYTDSTLTFTFYGARQGRRVESSTGPQSNFRSPQASYAYDPSAPRGSVRTIAGSQQQGFDITVYRKVFEHGTLVRKDSFTSHYVAVGDTMVYGPGTDPPRIDFVLPSI
jgi:vancomycin resistance protein YoaR